MTGRPFFAGKDRAHHISRADQDYLLDVARDAWRLFEQHVDAQNHHLPPDNVQTAPYLAVAHRTSPTNIGLYLLATACAKHFGWIDTAEMLARFENTLSTLAQLPRYRGHFLNWYDTQTLQPLAPAYVSTVDSGNLCGHLLAAVGACEELLIDTSTDAREAERLQTLAERCARLAHEADFGFLYDAKRHLFRIGFRVAEQQLDRSYYDLLASEARLASLWAIAKGDVPVSHWAALARPFYAAGSHVGLRSWSGSMFEYLMPQLVIDEPRGSALEAAARSALHEQLLFAHAHEVPWGISESAFAARDDTLAYQYAPQGVPRLALRRTPADELVVAPYATALAAMVDAPAAADNLRALEGFSARRAMGFVEAVDFTSERQTSDQRYTVVSTFMAHHQGMTIVALANTLLTGAPRRWCMHHPRIGAVMSLLEERVPREVSDLFETPPGPSESDRRDNAHGTAQELIPGRTALQPTHLLSNGRYSVALRSNGAGYSRFEKADVSRWRDDALQDAHGTFFYLRRNDAVPVSITQHPAPDPAASYHATFHADRVDLDARWADLHVHCTVWVSAEDDIELRRVELRNDTSQAISLELMSMFEVSLTDSRADEMHPAFANLFVSADWDAHDQALYLARKPRLATETGLQAVHFIAQIKGRATTVRATANRSCWLGRNRNTSCPLASYDEGSYDNRQSGNPTGQPQELSTGLDPIASLSMRLTIPPNGGARVTVGTAAATDRVALEALVDRYRQASTIERSSLMSATFIGIHLREMRIRSDELFAIRSLTTTLALLVPRPEAPTDDTLCDRRLLWRFGVSGDRPIVVVSINGEPGLRLVRSLVQALRLWSWGGLLCDLVILNAETRSYQMPLQRELTTLCERYAREAAATATACGMKVLHTDEVTVPERATLTALARLRFSADGRPLPHHVQELIEWHQASFDIRTRRTTASLSAPLAAAAADTPQGEFQPSGAFRFDVNGSMRPARPWVNVLANPQFGAQVSEAGAGFTWAHNSRLHQLTSWSNDPVTDASGEWLLIQDLYSRDVWSVGAGAGATDATYTVEHTQGLTTIRHRRGALEVASTWCVDSTQSVKHVRIALHNKGTHALHLRIIGCFEWVMGAQRADRQSVRSTFESLTCDTGLQLDVLFATQSNCGAGFGGSTAFVTMRGDESFAASFDEWTCDRRELFDTGGRRVIPDRFGKLAGAGLDPCAAVATTVTLAPDQATECVIIVGQADDLANARTVARDSTALPAAARERATMAQWHDLLGTVTVQTPDPLFDALVNRWLLYQALACRLWAPCRFLSGRRRVRISRPVAGRDGARSRCAGHAAATDSAAASRQFVEGDVQHWWHPPTGPGVRTRFSRRSAVAAAMRCVHYVRRHRRCTDARRDRLRSRRRIDSRWCRGRLLRAARQPAARTLYEHCCASHRPQPRGGRARLAIDGQRRLERRHEPRRNRGPRRIGVARLVPVAAGRRFAPIARARSDTDARATWDIARAAAGKMHCNGHGVGRRVVQARVLRRRDAARFTRQRRMPHRPDRAGVGGAVGGRAARATARGDGSRRAAAGRRRRTA